MGRGRQKSPLIVKSTGEVEAFDRRKLVRSLTRAGAPRAAAERIVEKVTEELEPGTTTRKIYSKAHRLLKRESRPAAGRYGLRRAILDLGPGGYPFEQFVAAVLEVDGWKTTTNVTLPGRCVRHEVDVLAKRRRQVVGIECKYRNQPKSKPDLKVALYVHARAQDLKKTGSVTDFWLVTNTKFTTDAERFARCAGLKLRALDDPLGSSLRDIIDKEGVYPITCLTTLKRSQTQALLKQDIVLSRQLLTDPSALSDLGLDARSIARVLEEVDSLPRPSGIG